jgi:hypothetical protein
MKIQYAHQNTVLREKLPLANKKLIAAIHGQEAVMK